MGKTFHGKSLYAASICRNKHMVAMDLRTPEAQAIIRDLIPQVDIVVENFRPGTLERWGLGYQDLCRHRPDLVMVRISGYGQSGPYSTRPGYGIIAEAMSGLRRINGDPDRPPGRLAIALTDYITGVYAAFGATMALLFREKTGKGQEIDAALYESAFSFMEPHIPAYEKTGFVANRLGSRLPDSTPNNLYATRDGEFIHITAMSDQIFRRLCNAMGNAALADDPRFLDQPSRTKHEDVLDDIIAQWTASLSLGEVEQLLQAASVPASPIYSMKDIFADPHYKARGMLQQVPDSDFGSITLAGGNAKAIAHAR
jgi:crotonobetainyl-CoA:carnitine CoA-transferase CaiB-like acyl-CoA transferase